MTMNQRSEDALIQQVRSLEAALQETKRQLSDLQKQSKSDWVDRAIDDIHQWLFYEGGHLQDVRELMQEYSAKTRSLGVPLDRLFIGGLMLHKETSAHVWKWEHGEEFTNREIPRASFDTFQASFEPDEPFRILYDGRADFVRMKHTDEQIPRDCNWFAEGNYTDYLALPLKHRGEFKGGVAYATKNGKGFSDSHIQFFHRSLTALSTVLRLHTNDLVMKALTEKLDVKVKERTEELEEANKRIQKQSDKHLEHFARMSHEIRTPLNAIVGLSNLLMEKEDLHETACEYMRLIASNGDLLISIVDDVLDYAKLNSDPVQPKMERTNLKEMSQTVIKTMQSGNTYNHRKKVSICFECKDDVPEFVNTDGRCLQQVLYSLLSNARKFSDEGGKVEVVISVNRDLSKQDGKMTADGMLRFLVKDYGRGIPKDDMTKIFEPFVQGSNNDAEELRSGTGLGLAIASRSITSLGGSISVKSELGSWTEFMVEMPYSVDDNSGRAPNLTSRASSQAPVDKDIPDEHTQGSSTVKRSLPSPNGAESFHVGESHLLNSVPHDEKIQQSSERPHKKRKPDAAAVPSHDKDRTSHVDPPGGKNSPKPASTTEETGGKGKGNSYEHIRALVVDDIKMNQKLLQRLLESVGVTDIDIAIDGRHAVEKSAEKQYDVIFMDIQMPRMDGLEATRIIKSRNDKLPPKIFVVTAYATKQYEEKSEECGGDKFVPKPLKRDIIKRLLDSVPPVAATKKSSASNGSTDIQ